jgi:large subunit ribosomal protein L10
MALTRIDKQELIDHYTDSVGTVSHAFLVDYKGITANQVTVLRAKIRESGGTYEVIKNRLMLRAIEGKPLGALKEYFQGPTAIAYAEDPVALAKVLSDFAKDVPAVEFKGGIVDGSAITGDQVKDIAGLPTRDELLAKLLYLLQSPITRLARGLAAIPRQFVVVLDQIAKDKAA